MQNFEKYPSNLHISTAILIILSIFHLYIFFCDTEKAYSILFEFEVFPVFVKSYECMDISDFKIHMAFPCFRFPEIHLLINWHYME